VRRHFLQQAQGQQVVRAERAADERDPLVARLPPLRQPGTVIGAIRPEGIRPEAVAGPDLAGLPVVAVGSHDTASGVIGVPAQGRDFAYISCGTWSLVGMELDQLVLTEASRMANFTNEAGVDGTIRYLRNVMGLWLLQESVRAWADAGQAADPGRLLGGVGEGTAAPGRRGSRRPGFPSAGRHARPHRRGGQANRAAAAR
jgi:sugar (pentulose or hexulose) kinase